MWTHFCNENRKRYGKKGVPIAGRYFIHFSENSRREIDIEYYLLHKSRFCSIGFDISDENWTFKICVPFIISLYFSFAGFDFLYKIAPKKKCIATWNDNKEFELIDERECCISIYDWIVRINPWSKRNEWCKKDPWWVRGISFDIKDILFGELEHKKEIVQKKQEIKIPMPEGTYDAEFVITENSWWRSRIPFFKTIHYYADINIPIWIPFNGKGENAWDCGTNGLFGVSVMLNTNKEASAQAIGHVVESVMSSRSRYGTPSMEEIDRWRSDKKEVNYE
jgi:hypothetical protein